MLSVRTNRDRVILDLHGRRDTSAMTWKTGERFVETLRKCADEADEWTGLPTICTGVANVFIQSHDGQVWLRFTMPTIGNPERVPMPADAARKLADQIEFKLQQAAYRMRFEFPTRPRKLARA